MHPEVVAKPCQCAHLGEISPPFRPISRMATELPTPWKRHISTVMLINVHSPKTALFCPVCQPHHPSSLKNAFLNTGTLNFCARISPGNSSETGFENIKELLSKPQIKNRNLWLVNSWWSSISWTSLTFKVIVKESSVWYHSKALSKLEHCNLCCRLWFCF